MRALIYLFGSFLLLCIMHILIPDINFVMIEMTWSVFMSLTLIDIAWKAKDKKLLTFSALFVAAYFLNTISYFVICPAGEKFTLIQAFPTYFLFFLIILTLIELRSYFLKYRPYYIKNFVNIAANLGVYLFLAFYIFSLITVTKPIIGPSIVLFVIGVIYKYADNECESTILVKSTGYAFIFLGGINATINLLRNFYGA